MDVSIDSKNQTEYNENTYYFCSEHCQHEFEQSPAQYVSQHDELDGCHKQDEHSHITTQTDELPINAQIYT